MRLHSDFNGHKCISTCHSIGPNFISRIPHVSRMWDEIIVDLFDDIKVELDITLDTYSVSVTNTGLLPDTDQDAPIELLEEVEE